MTDPPDRMQLHDIADRADVERLVRAFYERAMTDPLIGFIFTDVAELDLEAHLPVIASFWETMLLDANTYGGGAFHPHVALHRQVGLQRGHFERWLTLWHATVDELFAGETADVAKTSATRVANAFLRRLQSIPASGEVPTGPAPIVVTLHGRDDDLL